MDHDWLIEEREYLRQEERRGSRHAFTSLDPARTALVVVDVVDFFIDENDYVRGIVPRINELAGAMRRAGGTIAWVVPAPWEPSAMKAELLGPRIEDLYRHSGGTGTPRERVWTELDTDASVCSSRRRQSPTGRGLAAPYGGTMPQESGAMTPRPSEIRGLVASDPLGGMPIGATFGIEPSVFPGSDATSIPDGLNDWTYFDGAVGTVIIKQGELTLAAGTAVMIAPGLAMTATHVFSEQLRDLMNGDAVILLGTPRPGAFEFWRIRKIAMGERDNDVALLSLELASDIPRDGWKVRTIPLTTRAPRNGELVHVIGFRLDAAESSAAGITLTGGLLAARGEVVAIYPQQRDRVLMPYPTLEVSCGSLGGMSGGAVLDDAGHLVGVVSRGLSTEEGTGPTYASWVVGALNRVVELPWPPGVYPGRVHLMDLDHRLLRIEGRDKYRVVDETSYEYRVWFDRS